jgi:pseudomonalisin
MNALTLRRTTLTSLALALTMVLFTTGASAQSSNGVAAVASATLLRPGDAIQGTLSNAQPMHIVVALKLRNRDQLDSLVAAHKTLTSETFATQHAPTQMQAQAVADYLDRMGFKNVVIAPNRMLVSADGTANSARAAFLTSFARVQTMEGRAAFANNSDASIPSALRESVLSVIGLQNVYQPHTLAQRVQPKAGAGTFAITGDNPVEFSSIYGGTGVANAAGVIVGIVTIGDISQTITDLKTFTSNNGLPTVSTQTINTGGTSGDVTGIDEWDLDSQDVVGASGGRVGKIVFYNGPDFSNPSLVATFNTVVSANVAKIINVSLGECEIAAKDDGTSAATDQIFQTAAAQGQTFSVSTGDSGSDECHNGSTAASWPADSPYVVAAAGTRLDASTTTWSSEVVWAGSGGSPSSFEPKPSWQNALVPGTKRGVADIAFDADPYSGSLVIFNGGIQQFGGTSLSAPIFAGLWARVIRVKGTGIGFAAPLLYQLPEGDFHDITVGNNGGETAKVGYDFASGRGSMILGNAMKHVGLPSPLVVTFTYATSGLSAKFADHSTDSSSTIATRAWNFGDGGTSTAANPLHLFPKAGIYNVTEIVFDAAGNGNSATTAVTIGPR